MAPKQTKRPGADEFGSDDPEYLQAMEELRKKKKRREEEERRQREEERREREESRQRADAAHRAREEALKKRAQELERREHKLWAREWMTSGSEVKTESSTRRGKACAQREEELQTSPESIKQAGKRKKKTAPISIESSEDDRGLYPSAPLGGPLAGQSRVPATRPYVEIPRVPSSSNYTPVYMTSPTTGTGTSKGSRPTARASQKESTEAGMFAPRGQNNPCTQCIAHKQRCEDSGV